MTQTALITGASGGIGAALAVEFARHGHDLVLVARSESSLLDLANRLQAEHGVGVQLIVMDLSQSDAAPALVAELGRTPIDILVNNAGVGQFGPFERIPAADDLALLHLNIVTLTHLCKLLIPPMLERGAGRVLNVASTAAFAPGPLLATYHASKAYVLSLSVALAAEYAERGLTVTALCPGKTVTGFQRRAGITGDDGRGMAAEQVAREGYAALMRGEAVYVNGWRNRLNTLLTRFIARDSLARRVLAANGSRSGSA